MTTFLTFGGIAAGLLYIAATIVAIRLGRPSKATSRRAALAVRWSQAAFASAGLAFVLHLASALLGGSWISPAIWLGITLLAVYILRMRLSIRESHRRMDKWAWPR